MGQRIMLSISYHIIEPFFGFLWCGGLSTQNICDLVALTTISNPLSLSPPQPSTFTFRATKSSLTCELSVCHSLLKLHADTNVAKRYTSVRLFEARVYTHSSWDAKVFSRFICGCCFIYKILMYKLPRYIRFVNSIKSVARFQMWFINWIFYIHSKIFHT